jgi:pimeloyl-ACP methyl ester carboxylesterase
MNATWIDTLVTPAQRRKVRRGRAASTRPDLRFVDLKQASIRYRLAGAGPRTIVFAADPPVVVELYDELIRLLAGHCRVVVFEIPAFGLSLPRLGMPFDIVGIAEIIGEFLEKLGLGPYVLSFPCVTGFAAMWLAARHPHLVESLILTQVPDWEQELHWKQRRDPRNILGRPVLGQVLMKLLARKRAGAWYRYALAGETLVPQFSAATEQAFADGARFSLASVYQKLMGPEPPFGRIRQPTLALWGDADRSHAQTDKGSILRYFDQARVVHWAEVGHFPELEAPEAFVREISPIIAA